MPPHKRHEEQKGKNRMVLFILLGFIAITLALTWLKMGQLPPLQ